jgi:hypothetical protein
MKRKTNVQKITHLMVNYPGGPLAQAFVLEAVQRYADQVLAAGRPDDPGNGLVSACAWYDLADSMSRELKYWEV